ncbi:MAG: hypothetical protein EBU88_15125, partial [Acidobacteria bacterium]|nr:hypothetical protein [Acidobacteriota bacterium]
MADAQGSSLTIDLTIMLKWIVLAPLIGAIINGFFGKRLGEKLVGLMTVSEFAEVLQMSTATARRCLDKATSEGIAVCHKAATPTEP